MSKFLNIYFYEDPDISKISRLLAYYISVTGMMAFSALFKTSENRNVRINIVAFVNIYARLFFKTFIIIINIYYAIQTITFLT